MNARISQLRSVTSQVNCNNPEGIAALFGGMEDPAACTAIADECPELADIDDDGGGGGGGGNTDPIDRSDCITIGSGEVTAQITDDDPLFEGGHADVYCITLAAGNTLTATTAGVDGGSDFDSIITLLDPSDNGIASDDDGGDGFYSSLTTEILTDGEHVIVVHGFGSSDTGDYVLTVSQE